MPLSRFSEASWKRTWIGRSLIWGTGAVVLLCGILFVTSIYQSRNARVRLEHVIARLDSSDPNWRLEDLDKDFVQPPDDKNCAVFILQILKEKPGNWLSGTIQQEVGQPPPQTQLNPNQTLLLKKELERSPSTMALVRKLASVPRGYLKINWAADGISTVLPLVQQPREIATIAKYDALLRAQEGDFDGALESCRAILIAGRGNEPSSTILHMLVRGAIEAICVGEVERTLAQGEPSEAALAKLQDLLEDELSQPILSRAFRGERAMAYRMIDFTFKDNNGKAIMMNVGAAIGAKADLASKISVILLAPFVGSVESNKAVILETLTELIEVTRMSESEQYRAFARIEAMAVDWRQPALFRMLLPAITKVREAYLRTQARLRSAVAGMAAERYRRKHGVWPDKFESLVPAELKQVPLDVGSPGTELEFAL